MVGEWLCAGRSRVAGSSSTFAVVINALLHAIKCSLPFCILIILLTVAMDGGSRPTVARVTRTTAHPCKHWHPTGMYVMITFTMWWRCATVIQLLAVAICVMPVVGAVVMLLLLLLLLSANYPRRCMCSRPSLTLIDVICVSRYFMQMMKIKRFCMEQQDNTHIYTIQRHTDTPAHYESIRSTI